MAQVTIQVPAGNQDFSTDTNREKFVETVQRTICAVAPADYRKPHLDDGEWRLLGTWVVTFSNNGRQVSIEGRAHHEDGVMPLANWLAWQWNGKVVEFKH